ncbi:hypothetical protein [Pedobacter sp. WC2423]|uniref:hypothetical protein n=1 Tax=Pedobacter sp. WC2423 TaxID=3234142 RepID=UPI0034660D15
MDKNVNKMTLLGVKRGSIFSPNHIGNDEAIFNLTISELEKLGHQVTVCTENEFLTMPEVKEEFIFTMAREKDVILKLQILEKSGKIIINSGFGIENCFRINMTNALIKANVPYPKSKITATDQPDEDLFQDLPGDGFWIKRGDFHAIHKEDVTYVESEEQGRYILKEFSLRGIPNALISQNLLGDLVKFYGIRGSEFFYLFYPYDHNHHKYAEYEQTNGKTFHYPFDQELLKSAANTAAEALNIFVYGGDAIVSKDGTFRIIDFNDWPSFAPCRAQAAPHIAQCLIENFTLKVDERI